MSGGPAGLTDSHAHLTFPGLAEDVGAVLARARAAGVDRVLTVSARAGDAAEVAATAAMHDGVWAAVGLHPHEAAAHDDAMERAIAEAAASPRVVAIGEIGLDHHYDNSPRDMQEEAFRRQVRLARELGLPIVVHTREAEPETARVLEEERAGEVGGVIHCFTSSWWLAERCLDLGLSISLSGIVTFPSARELRDVAVRIPEDRLLVETDAPYLAPVPHRGKPNEPAHAAVTARFLAELRCISAEQLARATSANFDRIFRPA